MEDPSYECGGVENAKHVLLECPHYTQSTESCNLPPAPIICCYC